MSDVKQRLNQVLYEKIDRRTFIARAGLLLLAVFGLTKILNLSDLSFGGTKKPADTGTPGTSAQDASHHARAMAISSMRI